MTVGRKLNEVMTVYDKARLEQVPNKMSFSPFNVNFQQLALITLLLMSGTSHN